MFILHVHLCVFYVRAYLCSYLYVYVYTYTSIELHRMILPFFFFFLQKNGQISIEHIRELKTLGLNLSILV